MKVPHRQVINAEYELGFGGSPGGVAGVPAAMYNLASRLNHSCRPSAAYSWHRDTSTIIVRTLVPLAAGDEVCLWIMSPLRTVRF